MHLTRVDLPAPLSPTSAVTSPARTAKSTSWRTCTGPKLLFTPWISRMGSPMNRRLPVVTGLGCVVGEHIPARRSWMGNGRASGDAELGADRREVARADLGRLDIV